MTKLKKEILEEIRKKREFSQLPEKDIETAYSHFEKRQATEEEKIKLTNEMLRKLFSAFVSKKLLSLKDKDAEWILRKHISTNERLPYYLKVYSHLLKEYKTVSIIDLGAGINGFSYPFFEKSGVKADYTAIEAVGQLVEFMNYYFKKNKLSENQAKAIHLSLFETEKVLSLIKKEKKPKVIFMFKVIDALEALERDYSKKLISELVPLADKVIVSFATKSLGNKTAFRAKRNWITGFLNENFEILDDFELGGERYISFKKRQTPENTFK
jgi:hypothetical protein